MPLIIRARSTPYRPALLSTQAICGRCGIQFKNWNKYRDEIHHNLCRDCREMT